MKLTKILLSGITLCVSLLLARGHFGQFPDSGNGNGSGDPLSENYDPTIPFDDPWGVGDFPARPENGGGGAGGFPVATWEPPVSDPWGVERPDIGPLFPGDVGDPSGDPLSTDYDPTLPFPDPWGVGDFPNRPTTGSGSGPNTPTTGAAPAPKFDVGKFLKDLWGGLTRPSVGTTSGGAGGGTGGGSTQVRSVETSDKTPLYIAGGLVALALLTR